MVSKFYNLWAADDDREMIVVKYKNPDDVATEMDTLFADKTIKVLDVGAGTGRGGKVPALARNL